MDCWLLSVIYFFMFCMWGSILVLLIVNSIFGFNIFFLIKFFVKGISEVVFLIGQFLVYYGFWLFFVLLYYYLLWLVVKKVYLQRVIFFYDQVFFGDDIFIVDELVVREYSLLLERFGVIIFLFKFIILENGIFEFVKRYWIKDM